MINTRFSRIVMSVLLASSLSYPSGVLADDLGWPSEESDTPVKKVTPVQKPVSGEVSEQGKAAPALKMETPEAAKATTASPVKTRAKVSRKRKPVTLYGRLDQIASEANVTMPVLKAQKAKFDTSRPLTGSASVLKAGARSSRLFTGTTQRSFPVDFSGIWGGHLKVWRYNSSSLSDRIDPAESRQMSNILRPGKSGNVNFVFRQGGSNSIELEPAKVRLTIPAKDSYSYKKMFASNPQLSSMGGMVSNMMSNMQIPVILHFGTISTRGSAEVGISGNQIDQRVVKNVIRRLAPRVVEEQIVTRNHSTIASTGRVKNGYTESVLRFTRQSPTQLYVLAASVDYSGDRKFLRKLIMYGTVSKGVRTNTSAMPAGTGQLSSLLGGAGGAGGLSTILKSISGGSASRYPGSYGSSSYGNRSYGSGSGNYASMLRSLQSGGGLGALGGRGQGFSQVLKSLNMITR